mgnify:CR=1 FL=1
MGMEQKWNEYETGMEGEWNGNERRMEREFNVDGTAMERERLPAVDRMNDKAAKDALIKNFKLKEEQAVYILDMPLRRLTKMSKIELDTEQKELKKEIAALTALLKSDEALRAQVSTELDEVSKKYATPRRTVIA